MSVLSCTALQWGRNIWVCAQDQVAVYSFLSKREKEKEREEKEKKKDEEWNVCFIRIHSLILSDYLSHNEWGVLYCNAMHVTSEWNGMGD